MNELLIYGGIAVGVLIIALLFETSRDIILEFLGSIGDFFSGMFDNLSEFSWGGLIFGALTFGFIFALRKYMLNPFLVHMGHFEAIFWGGATYVASIIVGYLIGKRLFDE